MKKFKKILAAFTTAAVSAVTLCSMFSASAATAQQKTYKMFHNVVGGNNITYFDFTINYSTNVTGNPSVKTSLLNNGFFSSTNQGSVQTTYMGNPITQSGTVATTTFYTPLSVTNIFSQISYSATVKNSNGNIDPNSITMTPILMGDVNQDGVVNINDVQALNDYLINPNNKLNNDPQLAANGLLAADVMGDGVINSADSSLIMNYVTEMIIRL